MAKLKVIITAAEEDLDTIMAGLEAGGGDVSEPFTDAETGRTAVSAVFEVPGEVTDEDLASEEEFWFDRLDETGVTGATVRAVRFGRKRSVGAPLLMVGSAAAVIGIFAATARGPRGVSGLALAQEEHAEIAEENLQRASRSFVSAKQALNDGDCREAFVKLRDAQRDLTAGSISVAAMEKRTDRRSRLVGTLLNLGNRYEKLQNAVDGDFVRRCVRR